MIGLTGILVGLSGGAPAAAFDLGQLPGVALWLRGDDIVADTGWPARVGTAAVSGATKPALGATVGGKPAFDFSNVNAIMTVAQAIARPYWLIIVAKAPTTANQYLFDGESGARQSALFLNDNTVRFYSTQYNVGEPFTPGTDVLIVGNLPTGVANMDLAVNANTFHNQIGPGNEGNPTHLTIGNYLGGRSGGVAAIAEIAAGAGALSADDLLAVRAYALARYGIT